MFCASCGSQIPDGSAVCPACGAAQVPQQAAPQQPMYQQPMYQQPMAPMAPVQQPAKGLAIASLVCGILSLFVFAIVLGPLSIVFGGVAKSKGNRSPMATAGIVIGVIGVALYVLMLVFAGSLFGALL